MIGFGVDCAVLGHVLGYAGTFDCAFDWNFGLVHYQNTTLLAEIWTPYSLELLCLSALWSPSQGADVPLPSELDMLGTYAHLLPA